MQTTKRTIYRGQIAHFPHSSTQPEQDIVHIKDGALVVDGSKIVDIGEYKAIAPKYTDLNLIDYSDKLIVPGLIDSHVHFPQTEMIASYGKQLLSWLNNYTFPTEQKFACPQYSAFVAEVFLNQLIKNGTTTALAYASVHPQSVEALFSAAQKRNMAMIGGKVCMDRNCPPSLQDSPESAQTQSAELIDKWHKNGRNLYAITPRFAPTSTHEQMACLGELAQQYQDVFIQTHLSESIDEIAWVKSLFPEHKNYLDIYDHYHMLRPRAVFGHAIHLPDESWQRLREASACVAFCPSSNLFLGSGLFDYAKAQEYQVQVALATDVGGGSSFNLLRTYGEAYKVSQLKSQAINPIEGLYMLTQGPASAYGLSDEIGNLNPQTFADFVVLNPYFDELSSMKAEQEASLADNLFTLAILSDDRAVVETYIAGKPSKPAYNIGDTNALD